MPSLTLYVIALLYVKHDLILPMQTFPGDKPHVRYAARQQLCVGLRGGQLCAPPGGQQKRRENGGGG